MGLFSWFGFDPRERQAAPEPDTVNDPVFGAVVPDDEGIWIGKGVEFFPGLAPVSVTVASDGPGPSPAAREAYQELRRRYQTLAPAVAAQLFARAGKDNTYSRRYGVASAEELLQKARLRHVTIRADGPTAWFELGYDLPWDPEHSYDVEIEGWQVVRVSCNG